MSIVIRVSDPTYWGGQARTLGTEEEKLGPPVTGERSIAIVRLVCPYRWDARRRTLRSEVPRIREYAGVTYFAGQTPFFFRRSSSYPTYPTLTNVAFPVLVRRDLHTAEYRLALWETGRSNALFLSLAFRFYFFLWLFALGVRGADLTLN